MNQPLYVPKTSFDGYLPEFPFNIIHTKHLFPDDIRENDPELDINSLHEDGQLTGVRAVDKAMTLLVACEEQMSSMIKALPVEMEELGLINTAVGAFVRKDNDDYKLIYVPTREADNIWKAVFPDADGKTQSIELALPNHTIASILLRGIGFIPMIVNAPKDGSEIVNYEEVMSLEKKSADHVHVVVRLKDNTWDDEKRVGKMKFMGNERMVASRLVEFSLPKDFNADDYFDPDEVELVQIAE